MPDTDRLNQLGQWISNGAERRGGEKKKKKETNSDWCYL